MAAARRRRLSSATIATLVLALLVLLPSAAATPSVGEDSHGELTITSITPVVEAEGTAVVRGRLTNATSRALSEPSVELVPRASTSRRSDIADWAEGSDPIEGQEADSATLEDIAPGDSATFTLSVEAEDLAPGASAGAAWVSVQSGASAVHTFIGVHRAKEYVPLEVVWGVPLLLPTDRRLFDSSGETRSRAWQAAVGPESRVARLTREAPDEDEAWLLDPTLLALPPEPVEGTDEAVAAAMSAEHDVRRRRAAALRDRLVGARTLVLPEADADVAAGATSRTAGRVMAPRLQGGRTLAGRLGARANVLWPADGVVTDQRSRDLQELHAGPETPTLLTHSAALVPSGFTPTGAARTTGGTPLLVSDETLSGIVGDLSDPADVTLARQRLVAETATVLRERPGTPRSLLIVPDRSATPSPEAYAALREASEEIPWLARGSVTDLLEDATTAPAEQTPRTRAEIAGSPTARPAPSAVLSEDRARRIARDERAVSTFASVRSDGPTWRRTLHPAVDQLTSARWRATPYAFVEMHRALSREVTLDREDLVVSSGEVNFFAETGRLQITVVNDTDVELSNLTVDLTSQNPAFRIEEPPERVTIGPGGRQTVTVQATALAAGRAPVHVVVTTPDGQELTDAATLRVQMRPTGDAVYWIIGGTAVVLLGAGTWRTVRRPRKTTSEDSP